MARERVEIDARLAARAVHAGESDEGGEIAVAFAGLGEEDDMRGRREEGEGRSLPSFSSLLPPPSSLERKLRPDDRRDAQLRAHLRKSHRASQLVVVREREGR